MKTIQIFKRTMMFSVMAMLLSLFSMNQSMAQTEYDPSGVWKYVVPTPEGDLTGELTISKTAEGYEVVIKSSVYGTIELEDVTFKEMILEGSSEVDGGLVDFEWKFDGDDLEGYAHTDDGSLEITATRKKDQ